MKEQFPRPRKPAVAARRAGHAPETAELDEEIAAARERLVTLLARVDGQDQAPESPGGEPEKFDYRARRFRPKAELEAAKPGPGPEPAAREAAAGESPKDAEVPAAKKGEEPPAAKGAEAEPEPVARIEAPAEPPPPDPKAAKAESKPEAPPAVREIAPPPPRETVPPEFRVPEPDPDAPPAPAPFWTEAEPSTTAQVAGRWEQRHELRRIPVGLWLTFICGALGLGFGLGWILRGAPPEPVATTKPESAEPARPVVSAPAPTVPARGAGSLVRLERPTRDLVPSLGINKFNEALAAETEGRLEEAMQLFKQAAEMSPRAPGVALRLGFIATRRGDLAAATEYFKQAVESGEGAAMAASQLAAMHADIKSWEAAEEWALIALSLEPMRGRHYILWGDFARRQGLSVQGIARYQVAQRRELDPIELSALRVRIALAELERGNVGALEKYLGEASPEQRKVPDWSMMMAALALHRGEDEKAAEHLREARAAYSLPMAMVQAKDMFFVDYYARPGAGSILRDMAAGTPKEKR